jgi:hypothetical protein
MGQVGPVAFRNAGQLYSHTYLSGERGCNAKIFSSLSRNFLMSNTSVADPGCLSRILIVIHPGSRIQKQQQKRWRNKIICPTFFCSHKVTIITKLKLILFLNWLVKEKFGPIYKEI